jgi:hypothetical protein
VTEQPKVDPPAEEEASAAGTAELRGAPAPRELRKVRSDIDRETVDELLHEAHAAGD